MSELSQVQVGREESEERSRVLAALEKKQGQRKSLAVELEQYKSCDPQTLKELRECSGRVWLCSAKGVVTLVAGEGTAVAKEAANRWTGTSS